MRIAFFVNSIESETPGYTTTTLALAAVQRGHSVVYVEPGDFILRPDDSLAVSVAVLPDASYKTPDKLHAALKDAAKQKKTFVISDIDILFLRNDPSLDVRDRPWAANAGIMFGRLAAEQGVIVVNDPDGLAQAQSKLYLQTFPEAVRPATLISRSIAEIRAFIDKHSKGCIVKPLQGSGGKNVFHIATPTDSNLNQIFEAASGDGYLIAQAYIPEAKAGDVRLFLMNGLPLLRDGSYAAFRRIPAKGDVRSNIHAAGTARKVKVTDTILRIAEMVRPKLVSDGMFLVGLDIVGDKLLEINVFTPGGLARLAEMYKTDFAARVIVALEEKATLRRAYGKTMPNSRLATL
ncbi:MULTISPECIES: glutathione synthetase [unclassified Mesorhizobium]|uniref:glutathione synthetase n=2 Tax=Mesorhizobium TaxID=68287 RepID=UPI000F752ACE|nr:MULTISPECIES: glutathione synthetase [unclassified Mesorhizobium]AZO22437.1 glutathione synthase [Mesorhizobium sp. M1E.F.Ca.ET.045.02.1.1]RUW31455.1 glutathione synthase [Mesorhizobium sp. M1E.F.Ca.ET.041.01.1.1]RWD90765.1 MAG: glutathione synthase [Mesorhizobium sp.]RWD92037.1 MAG: glutathione synthase [Mesorhizobium sp.]TIU31500.1 MAG: glutathione synthase [Mesorhizobium sp.]